VFAIGAVAQLSNFTHWSPDQVVTLTLIFLSVLVAVLFFVSNRFQRQVRRFIDRNFYVNRYDYRAQWSRVTDALDAVQSREEVFAATAALLKEVFIADQVTLAIRNEMDSELRPHLGKGLGHPQAALGMSSPLARQLAGERHAVLLDRRPDDFEYIPIYAENQDWLESTASQVIAPLFFGNELIGTMGLERAHTDDPFSFEDVALLDSIAGHVAAVLRAVELSQALAESREMDLMAQWSNLILHDLKNYLAPLRLIAQNLEMHRNKPNIAQISATDLHRVAGRMEALVRTISEFRDNPEQTKALLDLNGLVRETVDHLQLSGRADLDVRLDLSQSASVVGDPPLLRRVLENLITNAVEAMEGRGKLSLSTGQQDGIVSITVSDSGPGMSEAFVRERLFRPFATTKRQGWGLGLYQCRSVIKSHGGKVHVESHPGLGSSFRITLPAADAGAASGTVSVLHEPEGVPS
jgi:putative PEP-CTERM system histidine kinase